MTRAYSYLRFSTPEQMQGDSFRRQTNLAAEYAAKHGLELDTQLTFHDLGVSAFRAKNAEEGRLSDFLEAVENGVVAKGSFLLVENLDRVSRAKPRKAVRVLENLCESGVNVVTLSDGKLYNEETLDGDGGMSLIMSVLHFIRAHDESMQKSRRLRAVWEAKRQAAKENPKPIFGRCPAWLKLDKAAGAYQIIEEKAEVVRRIFALAVNGHGLLRIAKMLTDEGVAPIGGGKRWYHTSVRHILTNRAVLGYYTPAVVEYVNGKKTARPVGEPMKLYPPVIAEQLFESVKDTRGQLHGDSIEASKKRGRGTQNPFSGLGVCARCGAPMTMQNKSNGRRSNPGTDYRYLVCVEARYGRGCKYSALNLSDLSLSFERDIEHILATPPARNCETEAELKSLEGPIAALQDRIETLVRGYERVADPALLDRLTEARGELSVLQERERYLLALAVDTSGPVVHRRIVALQAALRADPKDAQRINGCMRAVFSGMSLDPESGIATLQWRGGGTSEFIFRLPEDEHHTQLRKNRQANLTPITSERARQMALKRRTATA